MRLGVLTGGGDAPGLNAALRAVVRTAVIHYRADVVGIGSGFAGLLRPPEFWPLSLDDVRGLVRRGGTILGCNRTSPFDCAGLDRSAEVVESVRWLGLDALICVAGRGSLAVSARLHGLGVPVVAIPKTVENDVWGCTATFGYATAVAQATDAIDRLQTFAESAHRVLYLEVMGARAGWIALAAGVAGGADAVLVPELPYDPGVLSELVATRRRRGKPSTIVVVSEGARPAGEAPRAEGAAARAAEAVAARSGAHDHRVTVLGPLQRGGDPVTHDRELASRYGAEAVRAAAEGAFGHVIAHQGDAWRRVPLDEVAERVRRIEPAGPEAWTARALGLTFSESASDSA